MTGSSVGSTSGAVTVRVTVERPTAPGVTCRTREAPVPVTLNPAVGATVVFDELAVTVSWSAV